MAATTQFERVSFVGNYVHEIFEKAGEFLGENVDSSGVVAFEAEFEWDGVGSDHRLSLNIEVQ